MHRVSSLSDLQLPAKHRLFIQTYLKNISNFKCIEKVILFGSCAKGTATENSDIDLFVVTKDKISEELEFNIIFDNVPELHEGYVKNDILLKSSEEYNKYKKTTGMVQKAVENEGIDLSRLLSISVQQAP